MFIQTNLLHYETSPLLVYSNYTQQMYPWRFGDYQHTRCLEKKLTVSFENLVVNDMNFEIFFDKTIKYNPKWRVLYHAGRAHS